MKEEDWGVNPIKSEKSSVDLDLCTVASEGMGV